MKSKGRERIKQEHISKRSKMTKKKFKIKHDWVGKVIHWELSKKLKFDHTNKWYMHNPESVLENEKQKLLFGEGLTHLQR